MCPFYWAKLTGLVTEIIATCDSSLTDDQWIQCQFYALRGDQGLDPLGEEGIGVWILGIFVGPGPGEPEEPLVLQPLGGGAVAGPVLLELVESLHRLQDDHDHAQAAGDPWIIRNSCGEGDEGCGDDLDRLQALEASLIPSALAAVPSLLIIQSVQDLFF